MSILSFLGFGSSREPAKTAGAETQTVRRIVESLEAMDPQRARFVAAFAYTLCRVARADLDVTDEERSAMERIVVERGHLSEEQAVLVVQMAKTQSVLFGATEDYLVTRELNRIATREEKLALLDCLFAVSAADETVSTVEDNEIVRIASELQLPREDVVDARSRYREYLAVLRGMPRPS